MSDRHAHVTVGPGQESWDRELSTSEFRRLGPAEKKLRSLVSLRRKIEAMEAIARRSRPFMGKDDLPTDRAKLRRWNDAELGLWPWAAPKIDDPRGSNRELMERFRRSLDIIEKRRRVVRGRGRLQIELEIREARIAALEQQGLRLLDENRQLRREVAGLQARLTA